ncbi:RING-H2 finger protein ATL70-like [Silene latifolia]|uniref:RING-H2 finger protein ATL70-like n=1 Tax=Silene latifolia TaxID=37657 RepID=UPI003D78251C
MADLDNKELLFIAGIGLLVNILLFATTLLISMCKSGTRNTDIEALHEGHYDADNDVNVGLLKEDHLQRSLKIIDFIPSIMFSQIKKERRGGCSICLKDGFEDEELCKVLPGCDHVFHSECIDEWLKKSQSCPVCRKDFGSLLSPV